MLTQDEISCHLGKLITIKYKKKETLLKQNSHCSHIIHVNKGLVKVFTERRNEKNIIFDITHSDGFIGLLDLNSDNYSYSAVALKESDVCLIPKEEFIDLIQQNKSLAKFLFGIQSNQHTYLINKLTSLGTKQMHGRLADVILYLCDKKYSNEDLFNHITRKELSEMTGMSPESAIRLLTEFKNDGLINMNGKKIEINNIELLTRLSDIG